MPLKRWIVERMNRANRVVGRPDLAGRPGRSHGSRLPQEPSLNAVPDDERLATPPAYLGAYAPLIGAIRDELELFVTSQLRLHLAIAERDRYLLTSIDVECIDGGDGVDLLRRFEREFTPEQVKRFLARDVIAHLPNASAIDLSQFGGLNAADAKRGARADDDGYEALLAELRATTRSEGPRSFEVALVGRWTDYDASGATRAPASPRTPLAGSRLDIDVEDASGSRHLALTAIVPNRRYAIGKGEGCDVTVDGTYTSRRHCEIWIENGAWWAADAGSTNGIRVETSDRVLGRAGPQTESAGARPAIEVLPGARIVLSASARGPADDYPRLLLRQPQARTAASTPLGATAPFAATPVTPIARPLERSVDFQLVAKMASGERALAVAGKTLPIRVGRSRTQDVVVDWAHEGVSGHHIDITGIGENAVDVEVHGDNGVTVDGVDHAPGDRFRWKVGQRMTLGRASGREPECMLTLALRD